MKQSLKERSKLLNGGLPFMEGREKGELESLYGQPVTIIEYGFMKDENKKEYVCFIVAEDKDRFYFGGKVLTESLQELEADGYHEEIASEGLPVLLTEKANKKGNRSYTAVEFYPEG